MSLSIWLLIIFILLFIISGIYMLYKSARKFNLTPEQLEKIKQHNKELEQEDK
ncbi:MAG: DUF2897 family protein [Thalassotalea sp.]|nr:DUF2897 family protein [Thalassotalea sp.]MDG2394362.1 DUF2897 family protein [Thalassotalea sp.]